MHFQRDFQGNWSQKNVRFNGNFNNGHSYTASSTSLGLNLAPVDWSRVSLAPFQKDFYEVQPKAAARSEEEVESYRTSKEITVIGNDVPRPIQAFSDVSLPGKVGKEISSAGFGEPTAIQSQAWPTCLSGRDLVGVAQTGSGKTLAFLVPAIVHILAQPPLKVGDGPIALVCAPTRELAVQILKEAQRFGTSSGIKTTCVFGGVSREPQRMALMQGVHICVCTPGRMIDMLESLATNLRRVTYLVLDEADRMLDMGFEPQIRMIVGQVRKDRQTLLWSATWPTKVQRLAQEFLNDSFVQINIGSGDLHANKSIKQEARVVSSDQEKLLHTVQECQGHEYAGKIIIFTQTKRKCDQVAMYLRRLVPRVAAIHGDKSQKERDSVLGRLRSNQVRIMVATDVASRGLDVKDVDLVINFDMPTDIESYIHRIGRTGRKRMAGGYNEGRSLTFLTMDDVRVAKDLIAVMREAGQEVPQEVEQLSRHPVAKAKSSSRGIKNNSGWNNSYSGRHQMNPRHSRPVARSGYGGYNQGYQNSYPNVQYGSGLQTVQAFNGYGYQAAYPNQLNSQTQLNHEAQPFYAKGYAQPQMPVSSFQPQSYQWSPQAADVQLPGSYFNSDTNPTVANQ